MTTQETFEDAQSTPDRPLDGRGRTSGKPGMTTDAIDPLNSAFALDRLSQAFESSARRWELVVYPSLLAFIILAAYGFFLVFSLARDVHELSISADTNMTVMATTLKTIADDMAQISANVRTMSANADAMANHMDTLEPMLTSMGNMERSIQGLALNTAFIRDDMSSMNHAIGRPMHFMNSVIPW
jgi:hypothetical protein